MAARQLRVDFDDDPFCSLNAGERVGSTRAEAEPAGPVHRRDLQQKDVEWGALADDAGNLAEGVGHEMDYLAAALVELADQPPFARAEKERIQFDCVHQVDTYQRL